MALAVGGHHVQMGVVGVVGAVEHRKVRPPRLVLRRVPLRPTLQVPDRLATVVRNPDELVANGTLEAEPVTVV